MIKIVFDISQTLKKRNVLKSCKILLFTLNIRMISCETNRNELNYFKEVKDTAGPTVSGKPLLILDLSLGLQFIG